ncbi:glycosyltransferase family 4 protein [Bacillus timonensis]|nr:glycosyltransferase family 4 protein [Bacillus timonensis]
MAYVSHAKELGGAEYNLLDLMKDIELMQVNPYIISPANSELKSQLKNQQGINFYSHPLQRVNPLKGVKNIFSFIRGIFSLSSYFRQNIEIVHTCSYRGTLYGLFAGRMAGKKTVWHVHDIHKSFFYRKLMPLLADQIIVVSKAVGKQFSASTQNKKVTVIYNGVDLHIFQPSKVKGTIKEELHLDDNALLIGTVGRLARWKGQHHIIEAFPEVLQLFPHSHLIIAGDSIFTKKGYKESLKALVIQKGLTDHVHFLGQRTDIPNIMKSLDLFINFSKEEPFGRVITEAMAMETSVIVADSGGAPEIIKGQDCGLIVKTGDSKELANAMIQLLHLTPEERLIKGKNGRRKVLSNFDSSEISRKVQLVYDRMYSNKKPILDTKGLQSDFSRGKD